MAETMQGQRKWGYQTLHWWKNDENCGEFSFWSAHMNPLSRTSVHKHECITWITCIYGIVTFWDHSTRTFSSLYPGETKLVVPGEVHAIYNRQEFQCGFSETYAGPHENHEPVTERFPE